MEVTVLELMTTLAICIGAITLLIIWTGITGEILFTPKDKDWWDLTGPEKVKIFQKGFVLNCLIMLTVYILYCIRDWTITI